MHEDPKKCFVVFLNLECKIVPVSKAASHLDFVKFKFEN